MIVSSADAGESWSSAILVNDDTPGLHFFPTMSVDSLGRVNVGTKACVAYADGRDGDPDAYFACVDL